jgi:L-2-amino-thiazoline-4-carboxylic acid hydrolase
MVSEHVDTARRHLLTTTFPLATVACLGCGSVAAQTLAPGSGGKFSQDTGMTAEETYAFFYGSFIPTLQSLAKSLGPERFIRELTKAASDNTGQTIAAMAKDLPARDLKAFSKLLKSILDAPPYNKALTYEVAEDNARVLEIKYTECLPAKLFRAMNAAEIGYALECAGSAAAAKAFNPKIEASNPKNLMKGDAYCVERFELQA